MSTSTLVCERRRAQGIVRARDYLELTKPKIVLLELVTVAVAATLACDGLPDGWLLVQAMFGIGLVAASASVLNQCIERDLDAVMPRTANRPLPSGRLTNFEATIFGMLLVVVGFAQLWYFATPASAVVSLVTWASYLFLYTPMKTRTWLNTAVGTIPGALPVMIGWTAAGGGLTDIQGWLLTLVVVVWQFPHFMAIAWLYKDQYELAGYKMITNVEPSGLVAAWHAIIGSIALVPLSILVLQPQTPVSWLIALLGSLLCISQMMASIRFFKSRDRVTARSLLRHSLLYLPGILILVTIRSLL